MENVKTLLNPLDFPNFFETRYMDERIDFYKKILYKRFKLSLTGNRWKEDIGINGNHIYKNKYDYKPIYTDRGIEYILHNSPDSNMYNGQKVFIYISQNNKVIIYFRYNENLCFEKNCHYLLKTKTTNISPFAQAIEGFLKEGKVYNNSFKKFEGYKFTKKSFKFLKLKFVKNPEAHY